jgi:DNA-directed RNA polymerase specialized sigma24 family protein
MGRAIQRDRVGGSSATDAASLDEIITIHHPLVASRARRVLGNVDEVADVVQET